MADHKVVVAPRPGGVGVALDEKLAPRRDRRSRPRRTRRRALRASWCTLAPDSFGFSYAHARVLVLTSVAGPVFTRNVPPRRYPRRNLCHFALIRKGFQGDR